MVKTGTRLVRLLTGRSSIELYQIRRNKILKAIKEFGPILNRLNELQIPDGKIFLTERNILLRQVANLDDQTHGVVSTITLGQLTKQLEPIKLNARNLKEQIVQFSKNKVTEYLNTSVEDKNASALNRGIDVSSSPYLARNERQVEENFAGGNTATVSKITYGDGSIAVFKPKLTGSNPVVDQLKWGMPDNLDDANLEGRNVATYGVAKSLGLNIVPHTDYAVHGDHGGTSQAFVKGNSLGTQCDHVRGSDYNVMLYDIVFGDGSPPFSYGCDDRGKKQIEKKRARGNEKEQKALCEKLAAENHLWTIQKDHDCEAISNTVAEVEFSSPSMQKSVADAHILDLLTGQADRNPGNFIFAKQQDGTVEARLIDNDISFGETLTDISGDTVPQPDGTSPARPLLLPKLPRLIDQATADQITAMTNQDLQSTLTANGLTRGELQAAFKRLANLKNHIAEIQRGNVAGGQLVNNWNDQTFSELMAEPDNHMQPLVSGTFQILFNNKPELLKILQKGSSDDFVVFRRLLPGITGDYPAEILKNKNFLNALAVKPKLIQILIQKVSLAKRPDAIAKVYLDLESQLVVAGLRRELDD